MLLDNYGQFNLIFLVNIIMVVVYRLNLIQVASSAMVSKTVIQIMGTYKLIKIEFLMYMDNRLPKLITIVFRTIGVWLNRLLDQLRQNQFFDVMLSV